MTLDSDESKARSKGERLAEQRETEGKEGSMGRVCFINSAGIY